MKRSKYSPPNMSISKKILLTLSVLFFSYYGSAQSPGKKIIKEVYQNYAAHQNISYDVHYSMKFSSTKDTSSIKASVFIQRNQEDSVFGGKFLFTAKPQKEIDSIQKIVNYYNSKNIFTILVGSARTAVKYNHPAKEKWAITGNWTNGLIKTFFLQPKKLKAIYKDKENKITYTDLNSKAIVHIKYPSGAKRILHIDKANKTIEKMTLIIKGSLGTQFEEWVFSNIDFNSHNSKVFRERAEKYLKSYKIIEYKPPNDEYYALLENGAKAPSLKGTFYPNYSKKVQVNFDKPTIIDFWYTTCGPCIKAIPKLNKLKEKYGDKIQIIGINDKESKSDEKKTIENFLQRFPINYKILLTRKIPKAYNIKAYPTLYIIGKDGKIKYANIGYYKNMFSVLDEKISKLLEK